MKHLNKLILSGVVVVGGSLANAQSGPGAFYYMTAGDQNQNWTAWGGSAVSASQVTGGEYNIAVSGDLRTTSYSSSSLGRQYDLTMVSTGTNYAGTWNTVFDGTTDGSRNYTLNWANGEVMSYDRNWQAGSVLFDAGGVGEYLGITYDGSNGLWISRWNSSTVEHRSMTGSLLGRFDAGFSSITCLAMDYSDGTLWMGTQGTLGKFYQFSTSGTNLQSVTYSNMTSANTLGGEFNVNPVPEPASCAALGMGVLALLRRKKKTATL